MWNTQNPSDYALDLTVEMRRMRIASELLDSETRYLRSLGVVEVLSSRLKPEMPAEQHTRLFANCASIARVSACLERDLSDVLAAWTEDAPLIVGAVLVHLAPFLKLYSEYCSNFSLALETVSLLMSSNPAFERVLKESSTPDCLGTHRFDSFLILPIQRIPRYTLLLDRLLESTPPTHPDYKNVEHAKFLTSQVASFINERIHQHERFQEMLIVQRSISGFNEVLLVPGRSLIHSAKVTKVCRRNDQVRHLFLFSDILVYTMPATKIWSSEETFVFHRKIDLEHCSVRFVNDSSTVKFAFQVISPEKSFAAYTSSMEQTQDCVSKISAAIEARKKARKSLQIEPDSIHFNAPVWLPNKFAQACMICQSTFTLLSRKHHCRKCGNIVCNACSQNTFLIPGIKSKPDTLARACDMCSTSGAYMFGCGASSSSCGSMLQALPSLPVEPIDDYCDDSLTTKHYTGNAGVEMRRRASSGTLSGRGRGSVRSFATSDGGSFRMKRDGSMRSVMSTSALSDAIASGRSISGRSIMTGMEMQRRTSSFSSVLSIAALGGVGSGGMGCAVEKCGLCLDVFSLSNWKRTCKACHRPVCISCSRGLESGDVCDACVRGVPSDSVFVHEDGNGWSYIPEEEEEDDEGGERGR